MQPRINGIFERSFSRKFFCALLIVSSGVSFYFYAALIAQWQIQWSYGAVLNFFLAERSVVKTILLWNSADRIETAAFGLGSQAFVHNGCLVTACEMYDNRTVLPFDRYDAVVLNMHEIYRTKRPEQAGFNRTARQRFVFLTQESPQTMPYLNPRQYANYFNWTMSYKLNSDIQFLYGRVRPLHHSVAIDHQQQVDDLIRLTHRSSRNSAANKTRNVAWMVSHCDTASQRETYASELQKYIDVDIYGGCGSFSCRRNHTHWLSEPHCYKMLAEKYKFYLSFENSICQDYVTEKFFHILAHDLVPVVYGGANYSAIAPPHSFIDALQFTPAQLAAYLSRLSANDTLYNEFFWWKGLYAVEAGVEQMARHGFCDLCKKLHDDTAVRVYEEIDSQWSPWSLCHAMSSWLEGS